ncbi:hypothetical protein N7517_002236 [Penicillium concentricum]|uniref:Uncharacterized protein n=1 Tax=Penicillium concentricum TaxID=293559 RepID=A0A9W9VLC6_9EURO|nr:uncharacterized protein N7517_002236 [Penicillium concentricum]KAJ5384325.1 hypothetical protein N7517_002236 [Penicillium concentricum]
MSTTPITPSTEAQLPAFNDQLNLKVAHDWELAQIQDFMIDVIHNPSTYGVRPNLVSELGRLHTDILGLSENGSKYLSDTIYPQSISRRLNPAHNRKRPYYILEPMIYGGIPYWCSYDLLGRFLSIISPAPQGATQKNFYLPLTLLYANWCTKIGPIAPWAYSCVWAEEEGKSSRFQLGGSLAGYHNMKKDGYHWVKRLHQARFDILRDERIDAAEITVKTVEKHELESKVVPYGNCGETYPLTIMLRNRDPSQEVYGLAVKRTKLRKEPFGDRFSDPEGSMVLARPCEKCQNVIAIWGGKVENFITDDMPERFGAANQQQDAQDAPAAEQGHEPASELKLTLPSRPEQPAPADRIDEFFAKTVIDEPPISEKSPSPSKRPAPADDTAEPAAKRAKGLRPVVRLPSMAPPNLEKKDKK